MGSWLRDNRATVICAFVVAAVLAALWLALGARTPADGALVALVHDANGQVHELPLDTDDRLEVTTELGTNVIVVEDGAVRVAEADCPNGSCTRQHPLDAPGGQLICLPHQLWVEVAPEGSTGGELDVTLVEQEDDVDLVAR